MNPNQVVAELNDNFNSYNTGGVVYRKSSVEFAKKKVKRHNDNGDLYEDGVTSYVPDRLKEFIEQYPKKMRLL